MIRCWCAICGTTVRHDPDEDWPICCGEPMVEIDEADQ